MSKNPTSPKRQPPPGTIPDAVLRGLDDRSALFWLLHKHHDALSLAWKGRRVDWRVVCEWSEQEKAWDRTGKTALPSTAKMTWRRVCLLKAQERAQGA